MQCTTIRPLGVLIPAALLLSACSSANEAKEDITTTAEAAPSTEVAASSDPTLDTINEGEPFTITCDGDRTCDIDVTISNVALHDQCPRVASYVDAPPRSRPISPLTRRSPSMSTPGRITSPSPPATRKCSRRTDIRSRWASHSIANLCPPTGDSLTRVGENSARRTSTRYLRTRKISPSHPEVRRRLGYWIFRGLRPLLKVMTTPQSYPRNPPSRSMTPRHRLPRPYRTPGRPPPTASPTTPFTSVAPRYSPTAPPDGRNSAQRSSTPPCSPLQNSLPAPDLMQARGAFVHI